MTTRIPDFGPWTTSLDAGSRLTLSAFWKRRLRLLPTLRQSRSHPRLEGVALALALALGLVPSIHPVQGDESPMPVQQVVKVQATVPEAAAEFQYGEVMERTVYDNGHGEYLIDFDSGKVVEEPDDRRFRKSSELVGWARSEGIDAMGQVSSGYKGLIGFDMIVVPSDSESWDKRPAGVIESLEFGDPGTPATMDARAALPATFFVQTREGSQGVLQIVSVDEDNDRPGPDSIRLRYKPIVKKAQRQIFHPKKDLEASANWNALAEANAATKGAYRMMAHVPVGGVFPVQLVNSDGKTKTLFSVELVDGTDQSLQVNVVPFAEGGPQRWLEGQPAVDPAEMQRLTLQRDQPVDVVIDGEKYSLLFPTVHVNVDADPSTNHAQLIVTWQPHGYAVKHGATKR
jgi:hypothetical protein